MAKNIKKIIIKPDYELTDIVSDILNTKEDNLILTFTEESDLLISAITLKVILETADENEKLLLLQIIKNPSGVRNSKLAGLHVIDTANTPGEEIWEEILQEQEERLKPPKKVVKKQTEEPKEEEKASSFEQKVNAAIQRSREIPPKKKDEKQKPTDDSFITLGKDLPVDTKPQPFPTEEKKDFSKTDFRKAPKVENVPVQSMKDKKKRIKFDFKNIKLPKFKRKQKLEGHVPSKSMSKLKKLAPVIALSVVVFGGISLFAYYRIAPFVKIKIFVEAKEVSIEETFIGDENIKEINFEEKKIPIKIETVEKSRSTTTTATGTAYRGEKATGTVTLTYIKEGECTEEDTISLSAGQKIVSSTGYSYTLDSAATIACNNMSETSVSAIEVGEEYNISSGNFFTVQGYSSTQLYGLNSGGAFTGGSKEEYTVLSQNDVDSAVDELKETAISEGETELTEMSGSWVIIESSLDSDIVKDSIKTDTSVGAEASSVNVSLKTESSATYYFGDGFDDGITSLLTDEAEKLNLFDNKEEFDLILGEDIEKEISVEEGSTVKILLSITGSVKPDVAKEKILEELGGKSWDEGMQILEGYKYSEEPVQVSFNPSGIPERFWYFPGKQGGILLSIEDIVE